jgi:type IV pilus assembly protein PilW
MSIVEVMVAITISLILLIGVSEIFLGSRQAYNLQSATARMQENGRYALESLSRSISLAGAEVTPVIDNASAEGGGNTPDTLSVNFNSLAGENVQNCVGTTTTSATDTYTIANDAATGVPSLFCNGQPIVEGVENLQLLYGEDTDADGIANQYVPYNSLGDPDGNNIVTIRVAILVNSVEEVLADDEDTNTYALLDAPAQGPFNDADGEGDGEPLRRIYSRTVIVRNNLN